MKATGTFDVTITPQASDLSPEGPNLGRMSLAFALQHSCVFDYEIPKS